MNKIEAKKELIDICKQINVLLDEKYIVFDNHGEKVSTDVRFTFEDDAIYITYNDHCRAFYLLSEDSGTTVYGYSSYLNEIQAAKKQILKFKAVHPDNIISIKSLIPSKGEKSQ